MENIPCHHSQAQREIPSSSVWKVPENWGKRRALSVVVLTTAGLFGSFPWCYGGWGAVYLNSPYGALRKHK